MKPIGTLGSVWPGGLRWPGKTADDFANAMRVHRGLATNTSASKLVEASEMAWLLAVASVCMCIACKPAP